MRAGTSDHTTRNRHHWDTRAAAAHGPLARAHWSRTEPAWGLWATPEATLRVLPDDIAGQQVVELGCGTAYISAWLARAGAHPVGIDISTAQLATARAMQAEFDLHFPLLLADAEHAPCADNTFDLAISEYGASLWCDPHRWIPEAARLLRPGGRLVFLHRSPLFALCARPGQPAATTLQRPHADLDHVDHDTATEFTLPHGAMLRLLRANGFDVEDLIEIHAPATTHHDYPEVTARWGRQWPSEEIWKARLRPL